MFDGTYTRFHIQVSDWYLSLGWVTTLLSAWAWNAASQCMRDDAPHGVYVRSWQTVEDQFFCHAWVASSRLAAAAMGTSWDLEGNRQPNTSLKGWGGTGCNW